MIPPFVTRLRLQNFRSIRSCDVTFGPLTILVGPNGSGKSNVLDALAFLAEAVAGTPAQAIERRGGLREILHRDPEPAVAMSIEVEASRSLDLAVASWTYSFKVGVSDKPGQRPFEIVSEDCRMILAGGDGQPWGFTAHAGRVELFPPDRPYEPSVEPDRLYLPLAGSIGALAPLYGGLQRMAFYNFELGALRQLVPELRGAPLGAHGEHLGDVLAAIPDADKEQLDAYLAAIVPGFAGLHRRLEGSYSTVELRVNAGGGRGPGVFGPLAISDGTLQGAAVLAALFQPDVLDGRIPLVGIEEPEAGLHPGAAGALFDAMSEASERVQVVVTSHSADLLDRDDLDPGIIRAVAMEDGQTIVGEVDEASRKALHEKLLTPGELHRAVGLHPGPVDRSRT